jgi:hypothetical protein
MYSHGELLQKPGSIGRRILPTLGVVDAQQYILPFVWPWRRWDSREARPQLKKKKKIRLGGPVEDSRVD